MKKWLCIYHGGCDDGFAGAWCVRKALGEENVEFYYGDYDKPPPDVTGRDVIMVDFSYKRIVLDVMAKLANSILILDHHKTAQEELKGLPVPPPWEFWNSQAFWHDVPQEAIRVAALFDMQHSGAIIAWNYFFKEAAPAFLRYIEDRDLWQKRLPSTDEFTFALKSYPQSFIGWDNLMKLGVSALVDEGFVIKRYYRLRVDEVKKSAYLASIGGNLFWIANAPYFLASEVAGELSVNTGLGACYFEASKGRWQYSLRSREGHDVSVIAKKYGGGGHAAAAGFTVGFPLHTPC